MGVQEAGSLDIPVFYFINSPNTLVFNTGSTCLTIDLM